MKFLTEFGYQDEDVGEGSRTTTDFELDSNRAWNSILDFGQPRGMNEIRIRFIFPNSGVKRAMMPRSSHFTELEIQSVSASILCIIEKVPLDSIHYKFFSQLRSFVNEISRHLNISRN